MTFRSREVLPETQLTRFRTAARVRLSFRQIAGRDVAHGAFGDGITWFDGNTIRHWLFLSNQSQLLFNYFKQLFAQ